MAARNSILQIPNNRGNKLALHWRWQIRARDNYHCALCFDYGNQAHHILPWQDWPELRVDLFNGICLCEKCHQSIKSKELDYAYLFFNINAEKLNEQSLSSHRKL